MHESHDCRMCWGSSVKDYQCVKCDHADQTPGGWGELANPCPSADLYPLYYSEGAASLYPEGMNTREEKEKALSGWGLVLIERVINGQETRTAETLGLLLYPYDEKKRILFRTALAYAITHRAATKLFEEKAYTPEELAAKLYPDDPTKREFIIRMYRAYGKVPNAKTKKMEESKDQEESSTKAT